MASKYNLKDYTDDAVKAAMKDDEMFKAIKEGVTVDGKEGMRRTRMTCPMPKSPISSPTFGR